MEVSRVGSPEGVEEFVEEGRDGDDGGVSSSSAYGFGVAIAESRSSDRRIVGAGYLRIRRSSLAFCFSSCCKSRRSLSSDFVISLTVLSVAWKSILPLVGLCA